MSENTGLIEILEIIKNEWYCLNCYLWILNVKNESFIKKVKAHFLEVRKKQAEYEKAGEK